MLFVCYLLLVLHSYYRRRVRFCDSGEWRITDKLLYPLDTELADKMSNITLQTREPRDARGKGHVTTDDDDTACGQNIGGQNDNTNVLLLSNIVDKLDLSESENQAGQSYKL